MWSGPFASQLALGRVHPQLAPLREAGEGYELDVAVARDWFELSARRGFAAYGLSRALRMLLDVLGGLTALHDTRTASGGGFVHGELTPSLLRVDRQGVARLFPLAPRHWQKSASEPAPEIVGYLAPERLLGDEIDRRADVFGAGVLLWEALAGRRLFEHDSVDEIVTRLMGGKVLLPELPPELAWAIPLKAVAMRALSVDPVQRFRDGAELAQAIEAAARSRIASHADVAAYFAVQPPARADASGDAPRFPRLREVEQEFQSAHKSSLSALVAPVARRVPDIAELEVEVPKAHGGARRTLKTLAVLILIGGAGALGLTRRAQLGAFAQNVLRRAPSTLPLVPTVTVAAAEPAPPVTALPVAPTSAAPDAPAVPNAPVRAAAPSADSAELPAAAAKTPELRAPPPGHAKPSPRAPARDVKNRAAAKPGALPQTKPAAPRPHDSEAEQYGI